MSSTICLGIDIGIKNLSLCIYNIKNKEIIYWDSISVIPCENGGGDFSNDENCSYCKFKPKFWYKKLGTGNIYLCTRHSKKEKLELDEVLKEIKTAKVKNYKIQDLAYFTMQKMNELFESNSSEFSLVNKVRIELQPKFNPKMKLISHVIYTKLIDHYKNNINISFITAKSKMKVVFSDKTYYVQYPFKNTYPERKKLAINYTIHFVKNNILNNTMWLDLLHKPGKRDDLCDALLICI